LSEADFRVPVRERSEYAPKEDFLRRLKQARPESPSRLATLKQILSDADARYATAGDLADDLRRFVEGRPIATRPIGRAGRLRHWARRNPVTAALTGAVLALLLGVAVGSSVTAVYLQARLIKSEGNRPRAEDADRDSQDKKEPQ
jgi:eukaryotic-like serine/threonine-protein kinase